MNRPGLFSQFVRRASLKPAAWRTCVRLMEVAFGLRAHGTENVPRNRAVIFAGNHGSHYDGFFSTAAVVRAQRRLPVAVAWTGIRDYPILRDIAESGLPFIWKDDDDEAVMSGTIILREMAAHVRAGRSLVVHSEGRRNDRLGEFKPGAAAVSLLSRAPVVPFTLCGVQGLFSSLSGPDRFHGRVSIHFHAPLEPGPFREAHEEMAAAADAMTREIRRRVVCCIDYPDASAASS
jgi:1-acyl-sn-glycerol-3-phosphate acyltransferase